MHEIHTATPSTTPLDRALPAIVIHTALRRELRLAGPLVRRVPGGDTRRAAVVDDHLRVVVHLLHHHHENEDELVFPLLAERATGEDPPLVTLMQDQHAALERWMERVQAARPQWAATAGEAERDALATALEGLHEAVAEHLAAEEAHVLPMAERLLTDDEWIEVGRHGEKGAEGKDKLLVFGILAYEGDPDVLAAMLAEAPRPVRALLPRLALRRYRRHATRVHGTPTP